MTSNSRKIIPNYHSLDVSRSSQGYFPSVFNAFGKLKNINHNLIAAKYGLQNLKKKQSKQIAQEEIKQQQKLRKEEVEQFIHMEQQLKLESGKKKQFQLEHLYQRNQNIRRKNREMIQKVKEKFHKNNKSTFEQMKKNKMQNQYSIRSSRSELRQQKSRKRQRISNDYKKARKSIQNFRTSRFATIQKHKTNEVNEIMQMVMSKCSYLEHLGEQKRSLQSSQMTLSSIKRLDDCSINPQ